jgi:hypothetical protein
MGGEPSATFSHSLPPFLLANSCPVVVPKYTPALLLSICDHPFSVDGVE